MYIGHGGLWTKSGIYNCLLLDVCRHDVPDVRWQSAHDADQRADCLDSRGRPRTRIQRPRSTARVRRFSVITPCHFISSHLVWTELDWAEFRSDGLSWDEWCEPVYCQYACACCSAQFSVPLLLITVRVYWLCLLSYSTLGVALSRPQCALSSEPFLGEPFSCW